MRARFGWLILLALFISPQVSQCAPVVSDLFGRDASVGGVTLPDWEGYMANPAIELVITPLAGAALPVKVTVQGSDPRLYFDLPSDAVHWKPYNVTMEAEGGVPFYDWTISTGSLPPGLTLNRVTGAISGTTRKAGRFAFTVVLRDYHRNARGISRDLEITCRAGEPVEKP